jgi:hypothetical protein
MPFADVGGILRSLMSQVSLIELTPEEVARVRELVNELKAIYDRKAKKAGLKAS